VTFAQQILFANIIVGLGGFTVFLGHFFLSCSKRNFRKAHLLLVSGSFITAVGAFLLDSLPVMILCAGVTFISMKSVLSRKKEHYTRIIPILSPHKEVMLLLLVLSTVSLVLISWEAAAFAAVLLRLYVHAGFADQAITKDEYLLFSAAASVLMLTHINDYGAYTLVLSEIMCLIIGIYGYTVLQLDKDTDTKYTLFLKKHKLTKYISQARSVLDKI
jgi:hypothetical protein